MSFQSRVEAAIQRMLYPVVKLLMEYGVKESDFSRLVRTMFVKVAAENIESAPDGISNKATATRIALMTGIGRNNIKSILEDTKSVIGQDEWYRNRCATVLADWHNTAEYIDQRGSPIAIPFSSDEGPSFENLVKATAKTTLSPHAVLDELKLVGAVEEVPVDANDPHNEETVLVAKSKVFRRFGAQIEDLESAMDDLYNVASTKYEIMINDSKKVYAADWVTLDANARESHVLLNKLRKQLDGTVTATQKRAAGYIVPEGEAEETHRVGVFVCVYAEDKMAESRFFTNVLTEDEDVKVSNE